MLSRQIFYRHTKRNQLIELEKRYFCYRKPYTFIAAESKTQDMMMTKMKMR